MSWIENYQNIANLIVSAVVSSTLYMYYYLDEGYLDTAIPLVMWHFATDLFLTKKPDLMLHHILGLSFAGYKYIMQVQPPDDTDTILVLYKTEISTFFFVFKILLANNKNKLLVKINDLLFFITFFKYRIYDFYTILISNENLYIYAAKYSYSYILLSAVHGMFILNLYWFLIICKIAFKPIIRGLSQRITDYICHRITAYTMFLSLVVGIFTYGLFFNQRMLYDIFGIFILSVASYNYHMYSCKLIAKNKPFFYTADDTITFFLQDIGAIHLRSFLAVLTQFNFGASVYLSAAVHYLFYILNICQIYYLQGYFRITKESPVYNLFILFQYFCLIIPCELDIILICWNVRDSVYSIHGMYSSVLMFLIFIINPFYDLSHVAFHLCLILNTYICANCNKYAIANK